VRIETRESENSPGCRPAPGAGGSSAMARPGSSAWMASLGRRRKRRPFCFEAKPGVRRKVWTMARPRRPSVFVPIFRDAESVPVPDRPRQWFPHRPWRGFQVLPYRCRPPCRIGLDGGGPLQRDIEAPPESSPTAESTGAANLIIRDPETTIDLHARWPRGHPPATARWARPSRHLALGPSEYRKRAIEPRPFRQAAFAVARPDAGVVTGYSNATFCL